MDNLRYKALRYLEIAFASLVRAIEMSSGADEGFYFETRPIEVILADLAESWGRMQRIRDTLFAEPLTIAV